MVPEAQDIIDKVGKTNDDGQYEHGFVCAPAGRLLVPKARDDAEHGEGQTEGIEHGDAATRCAVLAAGFQVAVADAVVAVDVKTDEHPEHEANPGVGREENHEAEARQDAGNRHEGHEGRAEGAGHVGHRFAHNQYAGTHQGERQEGADAGHLARHAGRHEGGERGHGRHADEVVDGGGAEAVVNLREDRGEQTIVAHGHKYAALSHEQNKDNGAIANEDGQDNGLVEPGIGRGDETVGACAAHVVDGNGYRGDTFLSGKVGVVGHAGHDMAESHVEHGADEQGHEDAEGHVSFGISRFLGSGADGVEAEEGEKHNGGAAEHAAPAKFAQGAGVLREIGHIVVAVDILPADNNKHDDDGHFQKHDDVVEQRTLAGAADEEEAHDDNDGRCGEVDEAAVPRAGGEFVGEVDADGGQKVCEILAPRDADGDGGYGVFQHEVPTDNPGDELAHGGVGIGVGTAGNGNHGGKLGVTESGKGTTDGGHNEGEGDGGTGVAGGHRTGDGEEAGTDDDADAKGDETDGAENAAKRSLTAGTSFGLEEREWFSNE